MRRFRSPVMVGRERELAEFVAVAQSAAAGVVSVALVTGEAGIGKTRLVEELRARLESEALVLVGHGVELETGELPFGVLAESLRHLRSQLGEELFVDLSSDQAAALDPLVPASATSGPHDRVAILSAGLALVEGLARTRTVCWVLEDLQWVDAETRDLVGLLAGTTASGARLLIVGTVRTDDPPVKPVATVIARLQRLPRCVTIELDRLRDVAERQGLAVSVNPSLTPMESARVAEMSEGVPLLIEELASSWGTGSGTTVAATARARVATLDGTSRAVVEAAAIGEGHSSIQMLEEVSGLEGAAFDDAMERTVRAGLLESTVAGDGYRFRHALLRRAIEAGVAPAARRRWHERWAEVLSAHRVSATGDPALIGIARHRIAAGPNEGAFDAVVAASHTAAALGSAADQYAMDRALLDLWSQVPDGAERVGRNRAEVVMDALGLARTVAGDAAALEFAQQELDDLGPDDVVLAEWLGLRSLELRRQKGVGLPFLARGERDRLVRVFRAGHDRIAADGLLRLAASTNDGDAGEELLLEAMQRSEAAGAHPATLKARSIRSLILFRRGDFEGAAALNAQIVAEYPRAPSHELLYAEGDLIYCLLNLGAHHEAEEVWRRASERIRDPRVLGTAWGHLVENIAGCWLFTGRWDDVIALVGRSRSTWTGRLTNADLVEATVRLRRSGVLTGAEIWRDALGSETPGGPPDGEIYRLLGEAAELGGDLDSARAWYDAAWSVPNLTTIHEDLWPEMLETLRLESQAMLQARGTTTDVSISERASTVLDIAKGMSHQGLLRKAFHLEVDAHRALIEGRPARDQFEAALNEWRSLGHPYDEVACQFALTCLCLDLSRREEAARHAADARLTAASLGAEPLVRRVDELCKRARLGGSRTGERTSALTAREHEVLALVANGRTNQEIASTLFMSPKTASVHVSRIIAKLGASNRTEAAALARRAGLLG